MAISPATALNHNRLLHEAVGRFHDAARYGDAVRDLLHSGFRWEDLSILPSDKAVGKKGSYRYWRLQEAEDDPRAPRVALFPREAMAVSLGSSVGIPLYVAATITAVVMLAYGSAPVSAFAAAIAAGLVAGALGFGFAWLASKPHDGDIRQDIEHGGIILWVEVYSAAQEAKAADILRRNHASDVHIHTLAPETHAPDIPPPAAREAELHAPQ